MMPWPTAPSAWTRRRRDWLWRPRCTKPSATRPSSTAASSVWRWTVPAQGERGLVVDAAGAEGSFGVDGGAAQEHRLAVEQEVAAPGLDGAEADAVGDAVGAGFHGDVVEFGALRRPEVEPCVEGDAGETIGIGRERLRDAGFGDADGDLLGVVRAIEADPSGDARLRALLQLDAVILHEGGRHVNDADGGGEPAVVPPIGHDGGDEFLLALVVHLDDEDVALLADLAGDFELEGREAAFVLADLDAVEEDHGAIIGRAEPDEDAVSGLDGAIEIALIPDGAFVEYEVGALRVPIAGDLQAVGGIEIVFDEVARGFRFQIGAETAIGLRLVAIVVIAGFVRIDNGAPQSVEVDTLAGGGILDEVQFGGEGGENSQAEERGNKAEG